MKTLVSATSKMNLMSSREFGKTLKEVSDSEYRRLRDNYDSFLETSLKLGFFIPTDLDGNVLEEPEHYESYICSSGLYMPETWYDRCAAYKQAKSRVLFEGFEIIKYPEATEGEITKVIKYENCYAAYFLNHRWNLGVGLNTIEDLIGDRIPLTATAIKTIFKT